MAARPGSGGYSPKGGGLCYRLLYALYCGSYTYVIAVGVRDPASSLTLCPKVRELHLKLGGDIERYCLAQYEPLQLRFIVSSANVKLGQQCWLGKGLDVAKKRS